MVNSHYVPQLILRHFSTNDRIQYCDLDNHKLETRNIRTSFAEKGYYPDEIEQELCHKSEVQFANLLNNKLLPERNKIVLSKDELFTIKKYLIITIIRYNIDELIRREAGNSKGWINSYSKNFYININKILECESLEDLCRLLDIGDPKEALLEATKSENYGSVKLFSDVKSILHSYLVVVNTRQCGKDFIIPDRGFAYEATHVDLEGKNDHFDKCTYMLNYAMKTQNPYLLQMTLRATPFDYIICPIAKDRAIISFNVFYKFFNKNSDVYGMLPISGLTVFSLLNFGSSDIVEPPKVNTHCGKAVSYEYSIKQLTSADVHYLNSVLINTAEHHIGFNSLESIRASIEYYNELEEQYKKYKLDYLL